MIEIDGSYHEGGGQILRTSTSLSAITGKACKVKKIRFNRPTPGLRPQHIKSLEAAAKLSSAETTGLRNGSTEILFKPNTIRSGNFNIDIGTAGSVTLVLQNLMPICFFSKGKTKISISGGTDVKWSPPLDYFKDVFLYFLQKIGANVDFQVLRRGFYPKGGGKIVIETHPWDPTEFSFLETGELINVKCKSVVTNHLKNAEVAERQISGFKEEINRIFEHKVYYVDADSPGSVINAVVNFENSRLGSNALGERGKPAEKVGKEAAIKLKNQINNTPLDSYMADQIIPYMALSAQKGFNPKVMVSSITKHTETNIWVCEKFLDVKFKIEKNKISASST